MAANIRKLFACVALLFFGAVPGWSQDVGVTQSLIVTLDSDLVFQTTGVGQRIATNLEARVQELAEENRRIASELETEELDLTERRVDMSTEEFRTLAKAFDTKVTRIRAEQDAKQRELQRLRDAERNSFVDAITPLLSNIAREHGALVVLERRNVMLSADSIDITQEVIDRIDSALAANAPTVEENETTGQEDETDENAAPMGD